MKYVIIGNSAAGIAAAEEIRARDKEGEVVILRHHAQQGEPGCINRVVNGLAEGAQQLPPAAVHH